MAHYIVSRTGGAPAADTPIDELASSMFFQLWSVKSDPYNVLADGDTLWWADQKSRQVRWQMTVRNLRRHQSASIEAAREYLRRWYGAFPGDLSGYRTDGSFSNGWLLAWENEIVAPTKATLPPAFKLGRNGFKRVTVDELKQFGLTPSRRSPQRPIEPLDDCDLLAPPRERAIPAEIARQVWQRDGRRCAYCQTAEGSFHLDHLYPCSKGGPNTLDNLQVLCAPCNLAKAARVTGTLRPTVPALPTLHGAAEAMEQRVPTTPKELEAFLTRAVAEMREEPLVYLAWDLVLHQDASGQVCAAVRDGIYGHNTRLNVWARLIDAMLRGTPDDDVLRLTADEGDIGAAANAWACVVYDLPRNELVKAAKRAITAPHPYLAACGHMTLGETYKDDTKALEHMLLAFDLGNHALAARAALTLGSWLTDNASAINYLLHATRAKDLDIAVAAAHMLAERFENEPEIADYYESKAAELGALGS